VNLPTKNTLTAIYAAIAFSLGAGLVIAASFLQRESADLPKLEIPGYTWTRSDEVAPPQNEAIMGVWVDEAQLIPAPTVGVGSEWLEWHEQDGPAMLLRNYRPDWWIRLPGRER
jgi:hypothetical protein